MPINLISVEWSLLEHWTSARKAMPSVTKMLIAAVNSMSHVICGAVLEVSNSRVEEIRFFVDLDVNCLRSVFIHYDFLSHHVFLSFSVTCFSSSISFTPFCFFSPTLPQLFCFFFSLYSFSFVHSIHQSVHMIII